MSSHSPRINIVTNQDLYSSLSALAGLEDKSLSAIAKELIVEALEKREDRYLSEIANLRDKDSVKTKSHKEIWDI